MTRFSGEPALHMRKLDSLWGMMLKRRRLNEAFVNVLYVMIALKILVSPMLYDMPFGELWRYDFIELPVGLLIFPKILDALIIAWGILCVFSGKHLLWVMRIAALSIMMMVLGLISQVNADRQLSEALYNMAKFLGPFVVLCAMSAATVRSEIIARNNRFLAILIVGLTIFGILLMTPSNNRGREWMPAYFSGLHTSSYVALMGLALLLPRNRPIRRGSEIAASVFLAYMIVWGWGIRSAAICMIAGTGLIWFARKRQSRRLAFAVVGLMLLGMISAYMISNRVAGQIDWIQLSSGRLAEWPYRLSILAKRPPIEYFIGSGLGSDLMYSPVWYWEDKVSHNDFITVMHEQGILGFFLMSAILITAYRSGERNVFWNALWITYLISGLISVGLMFRPTPGYLFALALAASQVGAQARCPSLA